MKAISHKWAPIEDLKDPASLTDGELGPLLEVWKDQRTAIPEDNGVAEFRGRLAREWAIETGVIERAYTLERGTTETLIREGIKASLITRDSTNRDPDELAAILQDHLDALEGLFAFVKGERELTTSYVKEVQSVLLRHVTTHRVKDSSGKYFDAELIKGAYKTQPNSPTRPDGVIHEFCPPEQTASEMDRLIELHRDHLRKNIPPEVGAAWLHHAFTQIHPFADGNGRVARVLASLVFVKSGGFPLLIRRDDNVQYIRALEQADAGDLRLLVTLFVRAQRRALLGALQALPKMSKPPVVPEPTTPEAAIAVIRETLVHRDDSGVTPRAWEAAEGIASMLWQRGQTRMTNIVVDLRNEIGRFNAGFTFNFQLNGTPDPAKSLLIEVAGRAAYTPTEKVFKPSLTLTLQSTAVRQIVLSLHQIGPVYRGIIGGTLLLIESDSVANTVTDDFFQVNYKDAPAEAEKRFSTWLDQGLTRALTLWREQL